ncbi:MAG: hypothetical protein ACOC2L_00880, partial [Candidatus Sumerlaeota bacterium]
MLKCQTSFRRLFVQMIVLGIAVLSQAVGADIALTVVDPLHPVYGAGEIDAPAESQTLRLVAPRGGVGSAQVVAAGAGLGELTAKIGPLKGAAGTIPEDHLRIRYAAKEQGFDLYEKSLKEKVRGEVLEHHFTEVYYDRLHDAPVKDANGILPIWLTVRVPAGAAAGKYTGTLEAGGQSVAVE